ncbi:hypothetical protein [Corynebacterium occultum]|uniref:hypothetical protein n=1 Tax=Corynebacterium occultum TaxID=2675219 RepID=UPI0012E1C5CE|nr:hypothetical protein [Corynebacterium occultum]
MSKSRKKQNRRNKKPFDKEAYLNKLEDSARKDMDKSRAMIEEGLTAGQRRTGREKSPSAYRSTRYS